jgi:hypothetical protein
MKKSMKYILVVLVIVSMLSTMAMSVSQLRTSPIFHRGELL